MDDKFKIILETSAKVDKSKVQKEIDQQSKDVKVNAELNLKLDKAKLNNQIKNYIKINPKLPAETVSSLKNLKNSFSDLNKVDFGTAKKQFASVKSEMTVLGKTGNTVFGNLKNDISNFATFLGAGGIVMAGVRTIRSMITEVYNLDKSLVDLQMATGYTNDKTKELLNTYIDMGKQLGATGTEVASAASDYLRQGKSVADTNKLVTDSIVLAKIGNIDSTEATSYLTTAMKGYGVAVNDVIGIVDKLSSVDLVSATSAGGLATAMAQTATNANMAGVSMDKLLGYLAVVGETTGEAMSAVGNSFSTMFSRMANIKLKALTDPEAASDLNNVETSLKNVGIALRSDNKTFREFDDVLDDVAGKWNDLSEVNQRAIAVSIAGKDHMEDFLVLMQNYSKATDYTTVATNSSGTAMEKFGNYQESLEAKTKRLTASFQELASDTIDSGIVKGFLDLANGLVNVTDKIGIFNIALLATAGILGGKGIIMIPQVATFIGGLIKPMLGASAAAGTLAGTMGAALSAMIPVAVILGAVYAYNELNVTLEKTQAKLAKQKEAYDNEVSNVSALETELENVKAKLEELNNLGGASVVKDGEQEKLEAQTKELQRQLDIANEKKRIEGLKAEQTATETLGTEINSKYNAKTRFSELTGGKVVYEKVTRDVELQRAIDDYDKLSQTYEELEKKQQVLAKSSQGNSKEFKKNEKDLTDLNTKMQDARNYANNLASEMQTESDSLIGATETGKDMKEVVDGSLSSYSNWLNRINGTNVALDETKEVVSETTNNLIDSNEAIDDFQKSIELISKALSNPTALTSSDIVDLMQQFPQLAQYGFTGSEGISALSNALKFLASDLYKSSDSSIKSNKALKQMYLDAISSKDAIVSLTDAMTSMKDIDSIVKSVNSEMKEMGSISSETLTSMAEKYPQLESLIAEYNAGLASSGDIISALTGIYKQDESNFRKANNAKIEQSTSFYTQGYNSLPSYIKNLADSYGIDLKNYKNTALAKADINNKLVSALSKAWEDAGGDNLGDVDQQRLEQRILRQPNVVDLFALSDSINNVTAGLQTDLNITTPKSKNETKKEDKESEFSNQMDFAAERIKVLENEIDKLNAKLENTKSIKGQIEVYSGLIEKQSELTSAYKETSNIYNTQYTSALSKLSKSDRNKVTTGAFTIDQFSGTGKNSSDEKRYNAIQKAIDLRDKLASSEKESISSFSKMVDYAKNLADIPWNQAENKVENFNSEIDLLNAKLENADSFKVKNELLDQILDKQKQIVSSYKAAISDTDKQIGDIFGNIDKKNKVNSKGESVKIGTKIATGGVSDPQQLAYIVEYNKYIDELTENTKKLTLEQEKYKKEVEDTAVQKFENINSEIDKIISGYQKMLNQIDVSAGLMDDNSLEQIALYQSGLNESTEKSKKLSSEISKLNKQYSAQMISEEMYTERLSELSDQLDDTATAMKSYKDKIISAMKARYDDQSDLLKKNLDKELDALEQVHDETIDSLKDQLDAYKKIIDAKKESLRTTEDEYQYQKKLAEHTQTISKITDRMAELQKAANSGDRAAAAELKKLQDELAEAQSDLDDTQHDRKIKLEEDALDKAYNEYEDIINKQIDLADSAYENDKANSQKIYDDKLEKINTLYENEKQLIAEAATLTSSKFSEVFAQINSQLAEYGLSMSSGLSGALNSVNNGLSGIGSGIGSGASTGAGTSDAIKSLLQNGSGTKGDSELNKYIHGIYGTYLTYSEMVELAKKLGVSGITKTSDVESGANRSKILNALKSAKYETGGIVGSPSSSSNWVKNVTGEDGILLARQGEGVLKPRETDAYVELGNRTPELIDFLNAYKSNVLSSNNYTTNNTSNAPTFEITIPISGNADASTVNGLKSATNDIVNKVSDVIMKKMRIR